ncbi:MAG: hypothetical protein Q9226_000641 [Calogaya cf. arnoldii]
MNHSWDMPSADVDYMLNHVSNQMARSQLFRRLSANSNTSSPSRRPHARIVKAHSNGATPHGVQRRRTTTAHTSHFTPRTSQPTDPSQPLPRTAAAFPHGTRDVQLPSATRPLTWHPGSYPIDNCPAETAHSEAPDLHSFVVHQGSACADLSNYLSLDSNAASNTQLRNLGPDSYSQQAQANVSTFTYSYYNPSSSYLQHDTGTPYSYDSSFLSVQSVDFSQISSDYTIHSTSQTPDIFQSQAQSCAPQYVQSRLPIRVTKQKSKELVGMGLYDGPSRRELSTFTVSPDHIYQQPHGKGLKLEETWQPANDDGHDAEEEGYSTDEAEEELPHAPAPHDDRPALLPATYGDLSNQSFFFDSDDPFTDYMSFDSDVEVCQQKVSDAANQNFMWL